MSSVSASIFSLDTNTIPVLSLEVKTGAPRMEKCDNLKDAFSLHFIDTT